MSALTSISRGLFSNDSTMETRSQLASSSKEVLVL
jgi:hypothetical protein